MSTPTPTHTYTITSQAPRPPWGRTRAWVNTIGPTIVLIHLGLLGLDAAGTLPFSYKTVFLTWGFWVLCAIIVAQVTLLFAPGGPLARRPRAEGSR